MTRREAIQTTAAAAATLLLPVTPVEYPYPGCPKCGAQQFYCCSNRECVCWKRLPEGAMPQVYLGNDVLACPKCGFAAHIDFWGERETEAVYEEQCGEAGGSD